MTLAGCGDSAEVSTRWPNIAAGNYHVYASVNSNGAVAETNEQNNARSQSVFFATTQIFLPSINNNLVVQ